MNLFLLHWCIEAHMLSNTRTQQAQQHKIMMDKGKPDTFYLEAVLCLCVKGLWGRGQEKTHNINKKTQTTQVMKERHFDCRQTFNWNSSYCCCMQFQTEMDPYLGSLFLLICTSFLGIAKKKKEKQLSLQWTVGMTRALPINRLNHLLTDVLNQLLTAKATSPNPVWKAGKTKNHLCSFSFILQTGINKKKHYTVFSNSAYNKNVRKGILK